MAHYEGHGILKVFINGEWCEVGTTNGFTINTETGTIAVDDPQFIGKTLQFEYEMTPKPPRCREAQWKRELRGKRGK